MNYFFQFQNPWALLWFHPLTLEFIGGCLLGKLIQKYHLKIPSGLLIWGIVTFLTLSFFSYLTYKHNTGNTSLEDFWRILIFGIPAVFIVFFSILLEKNSTFFPKVGIYIGNASYSIYLSHLLVLNAFGKIWHSLHFHSSSDNLFFVPLIFLCTIICGILSFEYIEKPITRFLKSLTARIRF